MLSQILRPTGPGKRKHDNPWIIQGSWGKRNYPPGTSTQLYERLYNELIDAGLLEKGAPQPSRRHHTEVVNLVMHSSWMNARWIRDNQLAASS